MQEKLAKLQFGSAEPITRVVHRGGDTSTKGARVEADGRQHEECAEPDQKIDQKGKQRAPPFPNRKTFALSHRSPYYAVSSNPTGGRLEAHLSN